MKRFVIIVFLFIKCSLVAQTALDSLILRSEKLGEDTAKVNVLSKIAKKHLNTSDYEKALSYAEKSKQLADKLKYIEGLSVAHNIIGNIKYSQSDFPAALANYEASLKICLELADSAGMAIVYINLGNVNHAMGDYENALANYFKALSIREELGDELGCAPIYNNIAIFYMAKNNLDKALEYYQKALLMSEKAGDKLGLAGTHANIGLVYTRFGEYQKAIEHHFKSFTIHNEIGNKKGISTYYTNIANVYMQMNEFKKGLESQLKGLAISKETNYTKGIVIANINIGLCYIELGLLNEAESYLKEALKISVETNLKEHIKNTYESLSSLYEKMGNHAKALDYYNKYIDIKDTLFNETINRQLAEMNARYDSEKKDKELLKKDVEISRQQTEAESRILQRNIAVLALILLIIPMLFVYRAYRQKQKISIQLQEKNELIEKQKNSVEEKNQKITDSINYAKHIQQAILPSQQLVKSILPDSFIFFKPKDVVSGDFYWLHAIDKNQLLIAAVDCTGHGVPGALMSVMGYNLLEQVVKAHHLYQLDLILNELSEGITNGLQQTSETSAIKDGMDIALCKIDFTTNQLEYAGAHNSLYIVRDGKLTEVKADKRSVGITVGKESSFTNHTIEIKKGDTIYLFSDGFPDQKGGIENKKFFYKPFQQLLTDISQLPPEQQHQKLSTVFSEWKGKNEQMDDTLVIGIRI